jgi:glycosyltransferase involved in cell wall biosynthesis
MINKYPLITVVIPTYNRAKYIARGIRSVIRQTTGLWRLLIVDDGSTDRTRAVVRRFLKDPRIRYVRLK